MEAAKEAKKVTRWTVQRDRIQAVAENAARAFKDHAITPLFAAGGGNEYRAWRCAVPDSCHHAFTLYSVPGRLVVVGDLGALIVERQFDMLVWARGSIHDVSYFAEKVPREIPTEEYDPEMVRAWVAEVDADIASGEYEPDGKVAKAWADARQGVLWAIDDGQHAVADTLHGSGLYDLFDYPDFDNWKHSFLWQREAVKWFLANWKETA